MSTSTHTIGQVLDHSRRVAALNATNDVTTAWYNEQRTKLAFDDRQWSVIFAELPDDHRHASQRAYNDAYEAARHVTSELLEIVDRMRSWKVAEARERHQLGFARCMIIDSDADLRHGDLRGAQRGLQEAVAQLRKIHDKPRNSPRSVRHLSIELLDDIDFTVAQLNELADHLGSAA